MHSSLVSSKTNFSLLVFPVNFSIEYSTCIFHIENKSFFLYIDINLYSSISMTMTNDRSVKNRLILKVFGAKCKTFESFQSENLNLYQ